MNRSLRLAVLTGAILACLAASAADTEVQGCPSHGSGQAFTLTLVHFNDLHARYHPRIYDGEKVSPLALIKGFYESVKAENPCTLFVSAGDEIEKGCVADTVSRGRSTLDVYKALGLDLRVLGNHDFAYGLDMTADLRHQGGRHSDLLEHQAPQRPLGQGLRRG